MHAKIAEFPNKIMYGSRLKSHESVASRLLRDLPNIASTLQQGDGVDKEALETPVVFFDTAGCEFFERVDGGGDEGSKCNENEAEVVRQWVDDLVSWLSQFTNAY
jgi:DNA polymerase alpha-associated DNA helicase A